MSFGDQHNRAHGDSRPHVLLIATVVFVFLGVQVALAGQSGGAEKASHGKKHEKSSKSQLKKLRRVVEAQGAQIAALQGQSGVPATPTGPAGGDLAGTYPGPSIANGVITDANVAPANVDGANGIPSLRTLGAGPGQALAGNAAAGGDLTGSFPNPTLADGSIDSTDLFSVSLLDGAAGTPSLRTLGTGPNQALPGDATPGGPPTGAAGGGLTGTYPNPTIANEAVHASDLTDTITRSASFTAPDDGTPTTASLDCDAGERLLSGGVVLSLVQHSPDVQVLRSAPSDDDTWTVRVVNATGIPTIGDLTFSIRILCLDE